MKHQTVRPRGNPEKWSDPDRQRRFLEALRLGAPIGGACTQAGWAYTAWRHWARDAEAAEAAGEPCKYAELYREYLDAVRDGEIALLGVIRDAASMDWRAAAFLLERRHSGTYAKAPQQVEVSGPEGGAVVVDVRQQVMDAARSLKDADLGIVDDGPPAPEPEDDDAD